MLLDEPIFPSDRITEDKTDEYNQICPEEQDGKR